MSKLTKRAVVIFFVVFVLLINVMATTVFAVEETAVEISSQIYKTSDGLDFNYQTNVTLSVPGDQTDMSSDVVCIIGNGPESNSAYLIELIHKMLIAVDGTPTKIKLGLVCFGDTTAAETALELTEMVDVVPNNTVADFRVSERGNNGSVYTEPLNDYLARKEAAFAAWEAENPLLLEDMDYIIAKALEKAEDVEDGINLESALITARDMLMADETVPADRKHLIVVSTGLTYWFDNDDGFGSTVVGIDTRDAASRLDPNGAIDRYVHGNLYWLMARNQRQNTQSGYEIPFGWSFSTYWQNVTNWVANDRNDYVFTPVDANGNPVTYRQFMTAEDGYNNNTVYNPSGSASYRYGTMIGKPLDKATASGVYVPYFTPKTNPTGTSQEANNAAHALNYERGQYEAWVIYNQMKTSINDSFTTSLRDENDEFITVKGLGYNCYSVVIGSSLWLQDNQVGRGFMDMLAGGRAPIYNESNTDFFKPIANKILYTCAANSTVTDYIGRNENGNFEFIEDVNYIKLVVGGEEYTTAQIETKEGATSSYSFTAPEATEPTFWLDYYHGDGLDTEYFIWTFGESVSLERRAALTYKLQLTDTLTDIGVYDVPTNLKAYLDPVDSENNPGDRQYFPVPEVTYDLTEFGDEKPPEGPLPPVTGDSFNKIWFMLAIVSCAFIIMQVVLFKKKIDCKK